MNLIIESSLKTLQRAKLLLSALTNEQLGDESVPPYYSSIGSHLRHIIDFYDCILDIEDGKVDLIARKRNLNVEIDCDSAEVYLDSIVNKLKQLNLEDYKDVIVTDNLGIGITEIKYTYSSLLAQANSHTIHHYAIISYILNGLNLEIKDNDFGFNPTTPRRVNLE